MFNWSGNVICDVWLMRVGMACGGLCVPSTRSPVPDAGNT